MTRDSAVIGDAAGLGSAASEAAEEAAGGDVEPFQATMLIDQLIDGQTDGSAGGPIGGPIGGPTEPGADPLPDRASDPLLDAPVRRAARRPSRKARPTTEPLRRPESLTTRMRITRAVFLVLLTLLAPGSAQLAAGNARLGKVALRFWLVSIGLVVLTAALWLTDRRIVLYLATSPLLLMLLAIVLFAVALIWPALVVDAWRLGRPILLPRRARLAMTGLLLVSLVAATVPALAAGRRVWAAASLLDGVFAIGPGSAAVAGRYNVLLLGGDAGPERVGTRPDSMTLASIDARTGRTVLFGLPRNLENVRFPEGSPAARALPQGWTCGDQCLLNGIYTWGSEHPEAFPGARDPGAEAMKQAVEGVTGLEVNYYVLIDLLGFRRLVDAMGGIDVTVGERVPIGGGTSRVSGYIEPGTQRLDGYHALWFARSRHGASDYVRMARQKCVMNAMVRQMEPATLLAKFQDIAAAARDVMSTDIPASQLAEFIDLGGKGKTQKITSVSFVPPLVDPARPDFEVIGDRVVQALIDSKADPSPAASPSTLPGTVSPGPAAPASAASTGPTVATGPPVARSQPAPSRPAPDQAGASTSGAASSASPSAAPGTPVDVGAACAPA